MRHQVSNRRMLTGQRAGAAGGIKGGNPFTQAIARLIGGRDYLEESGLAYAVDIEDLCQVRQTT
jgi:hypothetical protein